MGSVHQGPVIRKGNELDVARADLTRALRRVARATAGEDASFAQLEDAALEAPDEAVRDFCEQELQRIEDSFDDELLINGVLFKRSHAPAQGDYRSLCGPLHPKRALYRLVGLRNGPTVVPLELTAGLVERATPALAYSIALNLGKETSRDYVESMGGARRHVPSRSTVERIAIAVGTKAKEAAPSIERYLRQSEGVPEGTLAVSIGLDRTTIPFEEERQEGEPPTTRRKKRTKPYERTPPPRVDVKYRHAYAGTVSFIDKDGEFVATRKYAATHLEGPDAILARMMGDLRAAKHRAPEIAVGLVQDGAPEMWNLPRAALDAEPCVDEYLEAIDRYHLSERLGEVLKILEPDEAAREALLEQWQDELDLDDETIDRIEQYIDERAWLYAGNARSTLLDALTYLDNNKDRMRYVALRRAGLPVGSGATEGSCKSVIGFRTKRSGQRWPDEGVSAVLTLRAIHQSDRLPGFWKHLARRYIARVDKVIRQDERVAA